LKPLEKVMNRKSRISLIAAMGTLAGAWLMVPAQAHEAHVVAAAAASDQAATSHAAVEVKTAMRQLWEDHLVYTRNYIISAVAGLPGVDAIAARLLRNQDDIGRAIAPYYGDAAGKALAALLRDHILIATEVVGAAKAGDEQQIAEAQAKWSGNGKDIAAFLSEANPNWLKADLEEMLQVHLDITTSEVVGRLQQDWEADIRSYDEVMPTC
jgi:hypothetical protein